MGAGDEQGAAVIDVFVSYATEDRAAAAKLADVLKATEGWKVWWDREIPVGLEYDEVIAKAVDRARCVIVLWSKNSVGSRWVKAEARDGLERNILAPVLLDQVQLPLEFRTLQGAQLWDWTGDADHPEVAKLVQRVRKLVAAGVSEIAQAPQDAPVATDVVPQQVAGRSTTDTKQRRRRWLMAIGGALAVTAAALAVKSKVVSLVSGGRVSEKLEPLPVVAPPVVAPPVVTPPPIQAVLLADKKVPRPLPVERKPGKPHLAAKLSAQPKESEVRALVKRIAATQDGEALSAAWTFDVVIGGHTISIPRHVYDDKGAQVPINQQEYLFWDSQQNTIPVNIVGTNVGHGWQAFGKGSIPLIRVGESSVRVVVPKNTPAGDFTVFLEIERLPAKH